MAGRLIALDLPGGEAFVDALRATWNAGDAVLPIDQRLPKPAAASLMADFGVAEVVDETGSTARSGGVPTEDGDALVIATSGSTGAPKGVVLTHRAIAASSEATSRRLAVSRDDHWLACLPLSHVGGLSVITRALHSDVRLTVHPRFDPAEVDASDATLVSLVPTALQQIDARRWRRIVLGGAPRPAGLPTNVTTTYGMTETASGVVYDGVPLDGVDVRVRDGELELRGPMLLRCYRDGSDPRRADGWFPTGDLGTIEADGAIVVYGRREELIISGGEKVWPEPVETLLREHPDVVDAAVVGVPDERWGQAVVALIVGRHPDAPNLAALREHVKAVLHPAHAPQRIVTVERLPRTVLGKLNRAQLQKLID